MTSAQVVDSKGKKVKEAELDKSIFELTPNEGLLHQALVRQLANARRGTACTKTRSEVSGGGKKPWRQKGTGRARAGSIRSPLWEGGGVTFGPKPRDYSVSLPKKQRTLALKSALSARANDFVIVDSFDSVVKEGKTKEFAQLLKNLSLNDKKVLLVVSGKENDKVERSARNIDHLTVVTVSHLNVKDLLNCQVVLTAEPVLSAITEHFQPQEKKESTKGSAKPKAKAAPAKAAGKKSAAKAEPKKAAGQDKEAKAKTAEKPAKAKKAE
jgi:large subunit ribosomal protein L4